jgi:hypothetical protein
MRGSSAVTLVPRLTKWTPLRGWAGNCSIEIAYQAAEATTHIRVEPLAADKRNFANRTGASGRSEESYRTGITPGNAGRIVPIQTTGECCAGYVGEKGLSVSNRCLAPELHRRISEHFRGDPGDERSSREQKRMPRCTGQERSTHC